MTLPYLNSSVPNLNFTRARTYWKDRILFSAVPLCVYKGWATNPHHHLLVRVGFHPDWETRAGCFPFMVYPASLGSRSRHHFRRLTGLHQNQNFGHVALEFDLAEELSNLPEFGSEQTSENRLWVEATYENNVAAWMKFVSRWRIDFSVVTLFVNTFKMYSS